MGLAWSSLMHFLRGDDSSIHEKSSDSRKGTEQDTPGSQVVATQRHPEITQALGGVEPPSEPGKMELRLMVETATSTSDSPSIFADGRNWTLSEPFDVDSAPPPPYICVSYVWGDGRVPNPVHPSITMSDRTVASFTAAACQQRGGGAAGKPTRIWIDAFCIPTERMKKRATLESLGFVFAQADTVVAVLAPQSIAAIEEMEAFLAVQPRPVEIPNAPIVALERDEWIRSVWTYQEVVNSKALWFVGYTRGNSPRQKSYSGYDVLNIVGDYLNRWGGSEGTSRHSTIRASYPHADNFPEILADWAISDYAHRSALQIMCGLDHRAHVAPENHFYSMIGALTDYPSIRATNPSVEELAERFMELCEEKGDYSFIFCAAQRDQRPGLRWRPVPCIFPPMFTWHVFGEGQFGERTAEGILLRNVTVFTLGAETRTPQALSAKTRKFMLKWFAEFVPDQTVSENDPDDVFIKGGYRGLRTLQFKGLEGEWHPTVAGVFYALSGVPAGEATLVVAVGLRWTFGAPAVASVVVDGAHQYVLGVFLGPDLNRIQTGTYTLR